MEEPGCPVCHGRMIFHDADEPFWYCSDLDCKGMINVIFDDEDDNDDLNRYVDSDRKEDWNIAMEMMNEKLYESAQIFPDQLFIIDLFTKGYTRIPPVPQFCYAPKPLQISYDYEVHSEFTYHIIDCWTLLTIEPHSKRGYCYNCQWLVEGYTRSTSSRPSWCSAKDPIQHCWIYAISGDYIEDFCKNCPWVILDKLEDMEWENDPPF